MNNVVCNIKSRCHDYNDMIDFVLNKYGIDDITLNVYEDLKTVDRFSKGDIEIHAIMVCYIKGQYVMYVRPKYMSPSILFHELTHLWQYQRDDLVMLENGLKYNWRGVVYDKSTEYTSRPWEDEAFKNQSKLYKEYKKHKRERRKQNK